VAGLLKVVSRAQTDYPTANDNDVFSHPAKLSRTNPGLATYR
jgi:hypothetical protein